MVGTEVELAGSQCCWPKYLELSMSDKSPLAGSRAIMGITCEEEGKGAGWGC